MLQRVTQNANDWSTRRGQARNRAFVHFVRPAVRSWPAAVAITAAESVGARPSNILRQHRCARHRKSAIAEVSRHCSVSMGSGSVGLSRLLTREDTDTLMRAFRAQHLLVVLQEKL